MAELPAPNESQPKSMREFDYFREEAFFEPANSSDLSQMRFEKARRNLRLHAVLIVVVTLSLGYLALGFIDLLGYHLSGQTQIDLGQAEEMEGKTWPVGHYVKVRGITENRGAQARFMRGLTASQGYWYVHLLGSPLFAELPSDEVKGKIEPFQEITLEGRLVDLHTAPEYKRVLSFFRTSLFMNLPDHAYMIQSEVRPDHPAPYIGFFALLALIPLINIAVWVRAYRKLQKLPR